MRKAINKYSLLFGFVIFILMLIIESLICFKFSYFYSLAYLFGLVTGLFNLFLTDLGLSRLEYSSVNRPKIFYTFLHIFKFVIYAIVLYISVVLFGKYTVITCAFGMLINKIVIYFLYLVKIPREDKKMLVDSLNLPKEIIEKLKYNDFFKVIDITEVNRERLLQFLNNSEVRLVINSLKEHELFIKGELEAILEDDDTDI